MPRIAFPAFVLMLAASTAAHAQSTTVTINKIDATGVGAAIGTLVLEDTAQRRALLSQPVQRRR